VANEKLGNSDSDTIKNVESLQQDNIQLNEELLDIKVKNEEKIRVFEADLEAANTVIAVANEKLGNSDSDTMKNIESLQQNNVQLNEELLDIKVKNKLL
jgi:hypothetical protein